MQIPEPHKEGAIGGECHRLSLLAPKLTSVLQCHVLNWDLCQIEEQEVAWR